MKANIYVSKTGKIELRLSACRLFQLRKSPQQPFNTPLGRKVYTVLFAE